MTGNSNPKPARDGWVKASCRVPGSGHLERSVPCQDRAGAWVTPRPSLMVLDGRGSARLSHLGATAALSALRAAIRRWEAELVVLLDASSHELAGIGWQGFAQLLYHIAATEQLKLAKWYDTGADSFEFTLTIAIVGTARIGWMAVGDSPLVISRHGIIGLATAFDEASFANQTTFVAARPKGRLGLRGGVIHSTGVDALIAMSDGTASRLLHLRQQIPSAAVAEIAKGLVTGAWSGSLLRDMLKEPGWDRVTRDDRSLALLALRSSAPAAPEPPVTHPQFGNLPSTEEAKAVSPAKKGHRSTAGFAMIALIGLFVAIRMTHHLAISRTGDGENAVHQSATHPHPQATTLSPGQDIPREQEIVLPPVNSTRILPIESRFPISAIPDRLNPPRLSPQTEPNTPPANRFPLRLQWHTDRQSPANPDIPGCPRTILREGFYDSVSAIHPPHP